MNNKGFIKAIIIIIIALVILGYVFNLSIVDVLNNPKVQQSLAWLWNLILVIWSYIQAPIMYLWNNFVLALWNAVQAGLGQ